MVCVAAMGTRLKATPDTNTYILAVFFKNEEGKEDATAITLTVGTLDLTKQQTKLFDPKNSHVCQEKRSAFRRFAFVSAISIGSALSLPITLWGTQPADPDEGKRQPATVGGGMRCAAEQESFGNRTTRLPRRKAGVHRSHRTSR